MFRRVVLCCPVPCCAGLVLVVLCRAILGSVAGVVSLGDVLRLLVLNGHPRLVISVCLFSFCSVVLCSVLECLIFFVLCSVKVLLRVVF